MPKPRKPSLVIMGLADDLPDRRTALADLRIALCLYLGVDPDDIDPASGYNHSLDAYLRVRASWVREHERSPDWWTWEHSKLARASWEQARPQYLVDHPWPEIRVPSYEEELAALGITGTPEAVDVPLPGMP